MNDSDPACKIASPTDAATSGGAAANGLTLVCGGPVPVTDHRPAANEQNDQGRRGVYLRRHQARVIEDDNLLVVEFLGDAAHPTVVAPPVLPRPPAWQAVLRWGASLPIRALKILRAARS